MASTEVVVRVQQSELDQCLDEPLLDLDRELVTRGDHGVVAHIDRGLQHGGERWQTFHYERSD